MQVTKDDLRKTYRKLSNGEIEHLIHHETSFTPTAKEVFIEEIERRRLPGSWASIVDGKGEVSHLGYHERKVAYVEDSPGPLGILGAIAGFFTMLFPTLLEIAFFGVWFLLCYIAYLVVDYFFFS